MGEGKCFGRNVRKLSERGTGSKVEPEMAEKGSQNKVEGHVIVSPA